jgi:hypothetical protein
MWSKKVDADRRREHKQMGGGREGEPSFGRVEIDCERKAKRQKAFVWY